MRSCWFLMFLRASKIWFDVLRAGLPTCWYESGWIVFHAFPIGLVIFLPWSPTWLAKPLTSPQLRRFCCCWFLMLDKALKTSSEIWIGCWPYWLYESGWIVFHAFPTVLVTCCPVVPTFLAKFLTSFQKSCCCWKGRSGRNIPLWFKVLWVSLTAPMLWPRAEFQSPSWTAFPMVSTCPITPLARLSPF